MAECLSFSVERILSRTTNVAGSSSTNNLDRQFSQTQRLNFSGFTYDSNEGSSTNPIPSAPDDQAVGAGCLKLSVSDKLVGHQQDRVKQHLPTPPCSPLSVASEPDPLNSDDWFPDSSVVAVQSDSALDQTELDSRAKEGGDHYRTRRGRMRFSSEQVHSLERRFQDQQYLLPAERKLLAARLGMSERQVKTWFQNKRAQIKRSHPFIGGIHYPAVMHPSLAMPFPTIPPFHNYPQLPLQELPVQALHGLPQIATIQGPLVVPVTSPHLHNMLNLLHK